MPQKPPLVKSFKSIPAEYSNAFRLFYNLPCLAAEIFRSVQNRSSVVIHCQQPTTAGSLSIRTCTALHINRITPGTVNQIQKSIQGHSFHEKLSPYYHYSKVLRRSPRQKTVFSRLQNAKFNLLHFKRAKTPSYLRNIGIYFS